VLERLKELLRHSAVYGLGSIVARVVAVLLLPLYTRYLSPSDYGLIETLVALSAVLTALVAQAMKSAFFRFYFDSAEPAPPRPRCSSPAWRSRSRSRGSSSTRVAMTAS
jgi:hypothetical protein